MCQRKKGGLALCLLLCPYHCQWVTADLCSSKGHKSEEKQFGVTVVSRIILCPAHDGLQ